MSIRKFSVNLIPKEEVKKRSFEKFLNWVLTYGRYIIIGTEIIVLVAFLLRFKLDRDLRTISEKVKDKQSVIESFKGVEEQTRALQTHLAIIKILQNQNLPPGQIVNSLSSLTPQDVIFSRLKISSSKIDLSATAFSLEGFSVFLEGLKRSKEFGDISLEKVVEGQLGIEFALKINYRGD